MPESEINVHRETENSPDVSKSETFQKVENREVEYVPGLSDETEIDQAKVDQYYKLDRNGPVVGHGEIKNKETGQVVVAAIKATRDRHHFADYDIKGESTQYRVEDQKGKVVGLIILREDTPGRYEKYKDVINRKVHTAEDHYGDSEELNPIKVFIEFMASKSTANFTIDNNNEYSGVGKLLYEIAIERSFQIGGEGKVQAQAAWKSAPFHEASGLRGQDVRSRESDELLKSGQQIHEELAELRLKTANQVREEVKKRGYYYDESDEDLVNIDGEISTAQLTKAVRNASPRSQEENDYTYFYLPPERIEQEKTRIKQKAHLEVSDATFEELMKKHDQLHNAELANKEYKYLLSKGDTLQSIPVIELLKLARLYKESTEPESAKELEAELERRQKA